MLNNFGSKQIGKMKDSATIYDTTPEDVRHLIHVSRRPLTKKQKQLLWECENERIVFKACLRKVISINKSPKHTSWNTAEVSNIQLT